MRSKVKRFNPTRARRPPDFIRSHSQRPSAEAWLDRMECCPTWSYLEQVGWRSLKDKLKNVSFLTLRFVHLRQSDRSHLRSFTSSTLHIWIGQSSPDLIRWATTPPYFVDEYGVDQQQVNCCDEMTAIWFGWSTS